MAVNCFFKIILWVITETDLLQGSLLQDYMYKPIILVLGNKLGILPLFASWENAKLVMLVRPHNVILFYKFLSYRLLL